MNRRHWKWLLALPVCIFGGVAALSHTKERVSASEPANAPVVAQPAGLAFTGREPLGKLRSDPFAPRSWSAPQLAAPMPAQAAATAPAEPAVPANPYRFAGTVQHAGKLTAVLEQGERVHVVKVGEVLDGVYRVDNVSRKAATLVYLPLGVEQQLAYVETDTRP